MHIQAELGWGQPISINGYRRNFWLKGLPYFETKIRLEKHKIGSTCTKEPRYFQHLPKLFMPLPLKLASGSPAVEISTAVPCVVSIRMRFGALK